MISKQRVEIVLGIGGGHGKTYAAGGLYVVQPDGPEPEQLVLAHPQIVGTLCASGAGLSRPAGQGNELNFCVVSAGFKHKAGSQSGSIGFQEETAPTLLAGQ